MQMDTGRIARLTHAPDDFASEDLGTDFRKRQFRTEMGVESFKARAVQDAHHAPVIARLARKYDTSVARRPDIAAGAIGEVEAAVKCASPDTRSVPKRRRQAGGIDRRPHQGPRLRGDKG